MIRSTRLTAKMEKVGFIQIMFDIHRQVDGRIQDGWLRGLAEAWTQVTCKPSKIVKLPCQLENQLA